MPKFTMLIGLPGCGKSTYTKMIDCFTKTTVVVSSDEIRVELYGDENIQDDPAKVFEIAKTRIVNALNSGKDAVLDATNTNRKQRIKFIKDVKHQVKKGIDLIVDAFWFAVPYEQCIERNAKRQRVVPSHVIKKMYTTFCPPGPEEGFDNIRIFFAESDYSGYSLDKYIDFADHFDQRNPHHTLSLGGHSRKCADYVKEHSESKLLYDVALLHDCGKPFTASFLNGKGILTDILHFYQHHCTGAYDSVFYLMNSGYTDAEAIYGARLIWWHMRPLREWKDSKKKMREDLDSMTPEFKNDFMILHNGDLLAH